jgi:cell division transport system permease protein
MMIYYLRAIRDIRNNKFLNAVTVVTIALSIMIVSAFLLFFINANQLVNSWKKGIRVMAYLQPDMTALEISALKQQITGMAGVEEVRYISKQDALQLLRAHLKRQSSLLSDLKTNPLPDTFEIRLLPSARNDKKVEQLAVEIENLSTVDDVEYGQEWVGRLSYIVRLFRLTAFAMGGLFFMASVFIVANTIRLVLYSRHAEIDIMRLVGASDRFITAPFYIEGLILGALGGLCGILTLLVTFAIITARFEGGFALGLMEIQFLPFGQVVAIIGCSMLIGWLGCYLSLKQFLKYDTPEAH